MIILGTVVNILRWWLTILEWSNSAIPRLVTRYGKLEDELKSFEKEITEEKNKEQEFEKKLRNLRKEKNKARLKTDKNPPAKRLKVETEGYVNIRKVWGAPEPSAPKKNPQEKEDGRANKRQKRSETITNIRNIENAVIEGESITDFEILKIDWEAHLRQHRIDLEKELEEKERRIKKRDIMEKSWQLYKESKKFLEENEEEWMKRKVEREEEAIKKERLEVAREKQEKLRKKINERKLKESLQLRKKELPMRERQRI